MKVNNVLVSALGVVCSQDNESLFYKAFESILSQNFKNFEVVLIVNGSISLVLKEYLVNCEEQFASLKVSYLPNNIGLAKALNIGIEVCSGSLVMRYDADDVSVPNRMKIQFDYFQDDPTIDILGCQILCINNKKSYIKKYPLRLFEIKKIFWIKNPIPHPGVMFKKEVVKRVGKYPVFNKSQDYALWAKVLKAGYALNNCHEILVKMNLGDGFSGRRDLSYFKSEIQVLKFIKDCGLTNNFQYSLAASLRFASRLLNTIKNNFRIDKVKIT